MSLLKIVPLKDAGTTFKEIRRKTKGYSLKDMQKITGMALATLHKLESGDGNFTKDQLIDCCKALDLGEPFVIFAMDTEDVNRLINTQP